MTKLYKVSYITTVNHNIGDDFVREGLSGLVREALQHELPHVGYEPLLIHKHSPVTNVYGFEAIRSLRASRLIDPALRTIGARNRISEANLLIQSGAPIYWCHENGSRCENNEWFDPLIRRRFLPDCRNRKFFNLAGGSCQRYHDDPENIINFPSTAAYMREFFDVCDLTTLRDTHAQAMLKAVGRDASVLPCTSIFAREALDISPEAGEYIVLNFMENGGHFTFGQAIDAQKWRENFRRIFFHCQKLGRVVLACHNQKEQELAQQVVPDAETFIVPDDHVEFMKFYARARFGIVNRVHAGFMLASLGKPVAVIGNDSRARMISNLNLPSFYVEDVTDPEQIVDVTAQKEHSYRSEIEEIIQAARDKYVELLRASL